MILFIICIIEDIPLKYLFSFIAIYSVTMSISLVLDSKRNREKNLLDEHQYLVLAGVNIITYIVLSLLINRYELDEHRWVIYLVALAILNIAYIESKNKYISKITLRILKNSIGSWVLRTFLLIFASGIVFVIWNTLTEVNVPNASKHRSSEVTGILSTIDPSVSGEIVESQVEEKMPWESLGRFLGIGNSGEDVLSIQKYLSEKGYYTGSLNGNYDEETARAINTYIGETTGEVFTRPEFGAMKLAFLRELSIENNDANTQANIWQEATWTLSTAESGAIQINSIESMDNWATASIQDGKIVVQVVSASETVSKSDNWEVQSVLKNARWSTGLQWVVISAAKPIPASGSYKDYQSITFFAEWASGIFFTADGSDPSCQWKWLTKLIRKSDTIIIKAISCYWWNKIRWPISSHTFMLNK